MLTFVLVVVAIGLFGLGVVKPRRSKRVEVKANRFLHALELRANRLPGLLGWFTKSPFWLSRKVTKISSKKGRHLRKKLPGD